MAKSDLLHDMSEAWVTLNNILQTIGGMNNGIIFGRGYRRIPPRSAAEQRHADEETIQHILQ